ncbi:MAG: glycosyltransferase [Gammaproteobacteria bacterium]|nr:glycosyltransferase [Gammaproteobacteria bacterium]
MTLARATTAGGPRLIVFSSLFPSSVQPHAGLFIRERMFRVGRHLPLVVVSPRPWFPGQALIRRLRPGYRPQPGRLEQQQGIEVRFPRFFALPGLLRQLDGFMMALASLPTLWRLKRRGYNVIDAHFTYPDGYAATLLGRWLNLPTSITLRGTEVPHSRNPALRARVAKALAGATRVFSVSDSLRQLAIRLGMPAAKSRVIGNGIDLERFSPVPRDAARRRFGLPDDARVLVSVGALVERKGFHRVIECLPELLVGEPKLHYLIVGGANPEGDMLPELRAQVAAAGLEARVHFLGALPPEELKWPLSAADVFVLATRNEGWANVFLEAMACGLPVVATDVGGNREVVCRADLGTIVPFGDRAALTAALRDALRRAWPRQAILDYAAENAWDTRVRVLLEEFAALRAGAHS